MAQLVNFLSFLEYHNVNLFVCLFISFGTTLECSEIIPAPVLSGDSNNVREPYVVLWLESKVSHMQSKCPNCCTTSPALNDF